MSAGKGSRNNVLAGIFVLAAAVLFVTVIVVMSNLGDAWTPQSKYFVRFSVVDGVDGLDKGAPVKIGGRRVGKVLALFPRDNEVTGEPEAVDVQIQIPASLKLYSDAEVTLIRPLLGSGSTVNIQSFTGSVAGDIDTSGPPKLVLPGGTLTGRLGPPGFIAPVDYARLRSILARVDDITREAQPQVKTIMINADASVANVRNITEDINKKWPTWSNQAGDVIARMEKASREFDSVVTSAKDVATSVKDGVAKAQEFIDKTRALIDDNRPAVDRIVKNIESITEKANTEWAAKVTGVMDEARKTLESTTAAAKEAQDLVARNSSKLDDMIANANLASQQLKLAMVEIRASPWRLLYQPTKKELENELLYNTVRQYSDAVGTLKNAADDLKTLSQRSAAGAQVSQAQIDAMTEKLRKAFADYQERERVFLEKWSKEAGK
jgi:ABC-type transporter Mla subunit MlaD